MQWMLQPLLILFFYMVTYDKLVLGVMSLFLIVAAVKILTGVVPLAALAIVGIAVLTYFATDGLIGHMQK